MDCSLPASSIHGIFQTRLLEWAAISFSRGSSDPGIKPGSLILQADSTTWATRETERSKKNHNPTATKTKPHYRKLISVERHKVISQMRDKVKTIKTIKWSGDRQPSRKRIHNNDNEDDSASQKKNEGRDWEDARNVYRRIKEQTEMNNTLEGINSSITEAEEQINDLDDWMVEITATKQNM